MFIRDYSRIVGGLITYLGSDKNCFFTTLLDVANGHLIPVVLFHGSC